MADTPMPLEDDLVKRLHDHESAARAIVTPPSGTTRAGWRQLAKDIGDAASTIRALSARVDKMRENENDYCARLDIMQFVINQARFDQHKLRDRAEAAEVKLREIAEIASWETRDKDAYILQGPALLVRDMRRIAALAHTATQPEATPGKGEGG